MSLIKKEFCFQTRYFHPYHKKDFGEIVIAGTGTYDPSRHFEIDDDMECHFDVNIQLLMLNGSDITRLYHSKEVLEDTLLNIVKNASLQHMEFIFTKEINNHFGINLMLYEDTEFDRHLEFPTAEELQTALNILKRSRFVPPIIPQGKTAA